MKHFTRLACLVMTCALTAMEEKKEPVWTIINDPVQKSSTIWDMIDEKIANSFSAFISLLLPKKDTTQQIQHNPFITNPDLLGLFLLEYDNSSLNATLHIRNNKISINDLGEINYFYSTLNPNSSEVKRLALSLKKLIADEEKKLNTSLHAPSWIKKFYLNKDSSYSSHCNLFKGSTHLIKYQDKEFKTLAKTILDEYIKVLKTVGELPTT